MDQYIEIGIYRITKVEDGKVWITRIDIEREGEGGQFDEQKLAAAIDAFYTEHF